MSFMDKIKSFFSGGSSADAHAGHDHSAHDHHDHDHSHEPAMPADPAGMPMSEPASEDEDRPA